uniref:Reverse transcriptase domain-containing protein n=1 Tax=Octopus bimaculoides TaxID=37653 RepID=A0A0L8GFU2_OCTBM
MQRILNNFSCASKAFGLTISIKKTELFITNLDSIVFNDVKMDKEIEGRIRKAISAFSKLYNMLWCSHDISLKVKVNEYKSVVFTTLFYGAESWTLCQKHINQLDAFHRRCLRIISNIKPGVHIHNNGVLTKYNISGIEAILIKVQLSWSGHLSRISDIRIPKQLPFHQFQTGRPLLRFKDRLKDNLKRCNIQFSSWENKASERGIWRHSSKIDSNTGTNFV